MPDEPQSGSARQAPAAHGWRGWLRRNRRRLIVIALVVAFFYLLGYFTHPVAIPGMCKIYG
ncbi:MAG: hypothetical protein GX576_10395 [Thauera phenolivorans]|uniref:Uncharacterized protein n=1 Tax=Thauera phenolivorans TaxID=1792543 RepID=A0A7X7LWR5_9RHOO|nr:hypothetical protein [Thauera phenolivorans]NLF54780.1 hypothetical protein [Thauera phenolivorans]